MMGSYNTTTTADKVIWTIGESWPLANMYGLAYGYDGSYYHHLSIRNNGSTYTRIGTAGGMYLSGTGVASSDWRAPIFYDSDNTGYYVDPNSTSNFSTVQTTRTYGYTDIRSPIFYDYDNTGYYVDPASTSNLNQLQSDRTYGFSDIRSPMYYNYSDTSIYLASNDISSYTQWKIGGSKGGYGGIYDVYSGVSGIMYDSGGNGGVYRPGNARWYFYYHFSNDCMGIGTSSTSSTYSLYLTKGVYAQSRIDATIFYDTNNTGYYVDPASTSNLNALTVTGVITANGAVELNGQNLRWNESGVRSWTLGTAASSGNLTLNSGDSFGIFRVNLPMAALGTLAVTGAATFSGDITLSGSNRHITIDATGNYAYLWLNAVSNSSYLIQNVTGSTVNGVSAGAAYLYMAAGQNFEFSWGGVTKASITSAGAVTFSSTATATDFILSSDMRLKTNITPITSALTKLNTITGYTFEFIKDSGKRRSGVLAQEIQDILPEAVYTDADGYLSVSYDAIIPLLIQAIKEQQKKIEELETVITRT